ncbi:MAG: hypothetical protein H8D78_19660 [Chloroflexi bacterium]|nr:hypothetical protein [Chloroflexota bacterium]
MRDYTSGFIAARRALFDEMDLRGDYGEYCIDFLARAQRRGYRVREVGCICGERHSGESKTGTNVLGYLRRGWLEIGLYEASSGERAPVLVAPLDDPHAPHDQWLEADHVILGTVMVVGD